METEYNKYFIKLRSIVNGFALPYPCAPSAY